MGRIGHCNDNPINIKQVSGLSLIALLENESVKYIEDKTYVKAYEDSDTI